MLAGMTPAPVRVDRDGGLAVATIDAPPLNQFDEPLRAALLAAVDDLERSGPRAVLVRAEGRMVSGGVDDRLFDAIGGPDDPRVRSRRR